MIILTNATNETAEVMTFLLHLTSKSLCKFHPALLPGLLLANKDYHDSKPVLLRLWIHEAFRVFADRLINRKDIFEFEEILDKVDSSAFKENAQLSTHNCTRVS